MIEAIERLRLINSYNWARYIIEIAVSYSLNNIYEYLLYVSRASKSLLGPAKYDIGNFC